MRYADLRSVSPNWIHDTPCMISSTAISVPTTHSPDHGSDQIEHHSDHQADQAARHQQPPSRHVPMPHADDDAQDAADDQRCRHQDRDDQRSLDRLVHQQKAADHVENAHQQMQRERTPLAIHEGVHDLEHAGHHQQRADEDDAGDGEGDDVEPGDDAQHKLGNTEGDEPAPPGLRAKMVGGCCQVAHGPNVNDECAARATWPGSRRLFHPGGARMRPVMIAAHSSQ